MAAPHQKGTRRVQVLFWIWCLLEIVQMVSVALKTPALQFMTSWKAISIPDVLHLRFEIRAKPT